MSARSMRRALRLGAGGLLIGWAVLAAGPAPAQELHSRVLPSEGLDAESAALLLSQEDGGDLPLRATMFVAAEGERDGGMDEEAGGGVLTVLLEMNRDDVGLGAGARRAPQPSIEGAVEADSGEAAAAEAVRLDVFLYQLDGELGVVDAHIRVIQIEAGAVGSGSTGEGAGRFRYLTQVPLGEGAREARVLVRARATRRAALRRRILGEPAPWPVLPIVSPRPLPAILDGGFAPSLVDWARSGVLEVGVSPDAALAADSTPSDGQPWSVRPREPGADGAGEDPVPLAAAIRVEPGRAVAGAMELEVEVRSGELVVWSETITAELGASDLEAGWTQVPLRPPLAELEPGRYRLSVRRASAAEDRSLQPPIFQEVLVRSSIDFTSTPFGGEGRRLAIPAPELAAETLSALQTMLEGDDAEALRRLSAVEHRALAGSGERMEAARAAQVRALVRLARTPDLLLPAIDLYLRAYRDRRAAEDFLLTTHAREMALALLEDYLGSAEADPAPAAAFLTALARARSPGPSDAAIPMLERAIELDEGAVDALWLRAVVAEAGGDLEQATRWWRLASESSEEREIDMHLGVALLRGEGRRTRRDGRAVLGALADGSDWIAQAARSELAREALQRGEVAEAVGWVDDADEHSDPSLQVLRSYLAFVRGEQHPLLAYGDAGHRGQEAVPARRRYATAWQRRDVTWSAPEEAAARLLARLRGGGS